MTNDERAEINQMKDDNTALAQFCGALQGQMSEIGDRLRRLEKKTKVVDGGDLDKKKSKKKPDDVHPRG